MIALTAADMKERFLILYDKVTNFAAPGYEDEEISIFLSQAQDQLVKRYYNYRGNKYQEGFEETEKRRKDLAELVRFSDIDCSGIIPGSQSGTSEQGIFVNLPTNILYTIREEVVIANAQDSCVTDNTRVGVKPITHDEYLANVDNPFNNPSTSKIWRLDYSDGQHELISDGTYDMVTYKLRYIETPKEIIVSDTQPQDCELNVSMHDEIVLTAVRIATGITDPANYNNKIQEELTKE